MNRHAPRNNGSTLMLALWALIVLSAVVFAWAQWIDGSIGAMAEANRGMEARALAHSGLAIALHPGIKRNSPHLSALFERGKAYEVAIESEGGRINLNYWLAGTDPAKIAFLKQYLALRGLTFQEREKLVDCLLDWVSPAGGVRRLNAVAESPGYRPPHRPLQSLDEVPLVAGSGPLVSQPGWKKDLTLYSTGPLDLESVPADLLAIIPGIGEQRARHFVQIREQLLDSNAQEFPFKNVAEALSYLGLSQQQFAQLCGFLSFRDPVLRITSVGQAGNVTRQVEAIVRKPPGESVQVIDRTEK